MLRRICPSHFRRRQISVETPWECTVTKIKNMYFQNPNSAASLPKTTFIFSKQIFIILCGLFYQWVQRLECWRGSASCPNYNILFTSGWNCQMLKAEQLLPGKAVWVALSNVHHGTHHSYWAIILQLIWSGCRSGSTLQLSAAFLSVPPLLLQTIGLIPIGYAAIGLIPLGFRTR